MRKIIVFLSLVINLSVFGQKDSTYYKKIHDSATSFIPLNEGYKIFSQKFGTGPIKLLLLHGGPLDTHELFEIFITQLPLDKYTIIWYDQLGSYYSDQPNDSTLWTIPRFVNEVEQVRKFYHLEHFYLLGHSWGGLLAIEYALKYPSHLKGLIISNKSYAQQNLVNTRKELIIQIAKDLNFSDKTIEQLQNGEKVTDTSESTKLSREFLKQHVVRLNPLPEAIERDIKHTRQNPKYIKQSNFHDRDTWNALSDLHKIQTPTLLIGSMYDFVKIDELEEMKKRISNSELYICPNGSHLDCWDDTKNYFDALTKFISQTDKKYYH